METLARPHQGVFLLGLSLIGVVLAFMGMPLGILVWYRANKDISAMNSGVMDPAGRDLTRLARLIGIQTIPLAALVAFVLVVTLTVPDHLYSGTIQISPR